MLFSRKILALSAAGAVLTASLGSAVWAGNVVLVAHQGFPVNSLSKDEVKAIYLSKKKNVSGTMVKLTATKDETLAGEFLRQYVGKTPSQFSSYYKKLIFTGKGKPPKSLTSESETISYVARSRGALGFISSAAVTDKVKIIQVTE